MWQTLVIVAIGSLLRKKTTDPVREVIQRAVRDSSGGRRLKPGTG